jgi:hypothetical protein
MRNLGELGERTGGRVRWPLRTAASMSSASSKIDGPSPARGLGRPLGRARASS